MGTLRRVQLVWATCLLYIGRTHIEADLLDDLLEERAGHVRNMRDRMLETFTKFQENVTTYGVPKWCVGYNTCSDKLPLDRCWTEYGNTQGCACAGRSISESFQVIKESQEVRVSDTTQPRNRRGRCSFVSFAFLWL